MFFNCYMMDIELPGRIMYMKIDGFTAQRVDKRVCSHHSTR